MLAGLLVAVAVAAPPLTIQVGADVAEVRLTCAGREIVAPVSGGVATFAEAPSGCEVRLVRRAGRIDGPGLWTCDEAGGCAMVDVPHAPISDAPGRLNIVLTGTYDTRYFELTCSDGYRQRGDIAENTATFEGLQRSDCELHFKGGSPARFRPIGPGSYRCTVTGSTALCKPFTPR